MPDAVDILARRWSLVLEAPFEQQGGSCAWVAPAWLSDGTCAVLKLAMPHFEGEHEIEGLRFWAGNGMVQLLDADDTLGAMLLERCHPGTPLRALSEPEQDVVLAQLLRRLWRSPPSPQPFRFLAEMLAHWTAEILAHPRSWRDPGLTRVALDVFRRLSQPTDGDVVLVTDLHAGNVLRAKRESWLAIDPKPFVGDPSYDATQHLLNCRARLMARAEDTVRRLADLLQLDHERVRLWTFARLAAEAGTESSDGDTVTLARKLAP